MQLDPLTPQFDNLFVFGTGENERIAQLVEQLTLNQRVAGSSPARFTIIKNDLRQAEQPAVFVCDKT